MTVSINVTIPNIIYTFCVVAILLGVLIFGVVQLFGLIKKWHLGRVLRKWERTADKDKVLVHFWRAKTIPTASPFSLKLETYLRMAQIPYELDTDDAMGPKGLMPWITYNGKSLGDSHFIIQFLNKEFGVDLNKNVSKERIWAARACRIMLEDHFFYGIVQHRVIDNLSAITKLLTIPSMFQWGLPLIRYQKKKLLYEIGFGRHTKEEIYQMMDDDLRTVSGVLGDQKFLGGDQPCEDDAAVFGTVAQAIWGLSGSSFEKLVNGELSNLKAYCERMKTLYWSDWENFIEKS